MDEAVAVFTILGGVANIAMAVLAGAALTLWRKQIAGASDHDLAKRLSGALRQVSIAREAALQDLRWCLDIRPNHSAGEMTDVNNIFTKLFGRQRLATSAPALATAVKELAALEGEVAVQWGDPMLDLIAVVRTESSSLAQFADGCLAGNKATLLKFSEPRIAPTYTRGAYEKALDMLTRLAQDWLAVHIGRDGARRISTAEFAAKRKQINDEIARLAEPEKGTFTDEAFEALSDKEKARLAKVFAQREEARAAAETGPTEAAKESIEADAGARRASEQEFEAE